MFRNLRKIIPAVFLVLILLTPNLFAQASAYIFNQAAGSYTAITGGTVLWSGTFDDEFSSAITMPSFTFNGTAYTTIYISANGYATLGSVSVGYTPIRSPRSRRRSRRRRPRRRRTLPESSGRKSQAPASAG